MVRSCLFREVSRHLKVIFCPKIGLEITKKSDDTRPKPGYMACVGNFTCRIRDGDRADATALGRVHATVLAVGVGRADVAVGGLQGVAVGALGNYAVVAGRGGAGERAYVLRLCQRLRLC